MTLVLWRKLFRDVRLILLAVALFLGLFQVFWAKVIERMLGRLSPLFNYLASMSGLTQQDLEGVLFEGTGKIVRTIIGGELVVLDNAMDMLSIGYVHPLMQLLFCVWAIGRAAGAIAGEIDRGTMELLLAQPLARSRLILAHLLLDITTIPLLCLSLWAGNWIGAWAISPIQVEQPNFKPPDLTRNFVLELGPLKFRIEDPLKRRLTPRPVDEQRMRERLRVEPARFGPSLWVVGGLIFAVTGYTMWISAAGRFRWRVLGVAVFITLVQFLLNILGQLWEPAAWLRPLTIFYYYQPQQVMLFGNWCVSWAEWNGGSPLVRLPMLVVLYGVGLIGYAMALWTLVRRDLPAPL